MQKHHIAQNAHCSPDSYLQSQKSVRPVIINSKRNHETFPLVDIYARCRELCSLSQDLSNENKRQEDYCFSSLFSYSITSDHISPFCFGKHFLKPGLNIKFHRRATETLKDIPYSFFDTEFHRPTAKAFKNIYLARSLNIDNSKTLYFH